MKICYLIVGIVCVLSLTVNGQQVISSAGGSGTGTGVQLSWTIGEPVIETFTGSTVILTQGFHQSRLTVTAIDPAVFPGLELSIFPNPVATSLKLQITGEQFKNLSYRLYTITGETILSKTVRTFPELINMEYYTSGTYLLKVFRDDNVPLKTFTVIKD